MSTTTDLIRIIDCYAAPEHGQEAIGLLSLVIVDLIGQISEEKKDGQSDMAYLTYYLEAAKQALGVLGEYDG